MMQRRRARAVIGGRDLPYRVRTSRTAQRLRIRVGPDGIEVVQPASRSMDDAASFLRSNEPWVAQQLDRVARLQSARRLRGENGGAILLHGQPTPVSIEEIPGYRGANRIEHRDGRILIATGSASPSTPARSLDRWLRKMARSAIETHASAVASRQGVTIGRIFIMDQRTKWANCSALGNLSFSWRVVMAPEHVLHYLVTHEVVHLAIPDHSPRFWLTVHSSCTETERARQWLAANSERLQIDLQALLAL
jgi:predicted metal-dependent hydrolase